MAIEKDGTAPYAPPAALIAGVERHRDRGLPTPIDKESIARTAITTKSLAQRTVQAMRLLDWIDDYGEPTEDFERLRRVPTEDFKSTLADMLRKAYADVLTFADPTKDDMERIADAFRYYKPPGMRPRMVSLFAGLMEYAEIVPEGQMTAARRPRSDQKRSSPASSGNDRRTIPRAVPSAPAADGPQSAAGSTTLPRSRSDEHPSTPVTRKLPPALLGFVNALPLDGETLSKERRERYIAAFTAVLDLSYEVEES